MATPKISKIEALKRLRGDVFSKVSGLKEGVRNYVGKQVSNEEIKKHLAEHLSQESSKLKSKRQIIDGLKKKYGLDWYAGKKIGDYLMPPEIKLTDAEKKKIIEGKIRTSRRISDIGNWRAKRGMVDRAEEIRNKIRAPHLNNVPELKEGQASPFALSSQSPSNFIGQKKEIAALTRNDEGGGVVPEKKAKELAETIKGEHTSAIKSSEASRKKNKEGEAEEDKADRTDIPLAV